MSDRIVIDLSGENVANDDPTKPQIYTPLPVDWYAGVVYEAEDKATGQQSKKPGSPYIKAVLKVSEGEYRGRSVRDGYIALSRSDPSQAFQTRRAEQLARIAGIPQPENGIALPLAEDIRGLELEFRVAHEHDEWAEEQYEDETGEAPPEPLMRERITGYRPVGGWPKGGTTAKAGGKAKKAITL